MTVTPNGEHMRLRVNFEEEVQNDHGGVNRALPVQDEKVYQDFFTRVDKSLFLERETVAASTDTLHVLR